MTKKIFLILSITFAILLSGTVVFANLGDSIRQGANDMGNQAKESWDKASNSVQNATNTVAGGVSDMMNGDDNNNNNNNNNENNIMGMTDNTTDNRYTAQRTANENPMNVMSNSMWTWVILAVLGVVIVSLVWFYGSQFKTQRHHEE